MSYENFPIDEELLKQAAQELERGGLVAFPTETVYGLGADAANAQAIKDLYALKGRPADHPSIVHLACAEDIDKWARDIPPQARRLARHFWPGPMTLILPKRPDVLDQVTGGQNSVGLRVPAHPLTRRLIEVFGRGIAGPSANRFGHISPTSAEHVRQEFGGELKYILDGGPCSVGVESTIIDFTQAKPVILRPGMLTETIINQYLGADITTGSGAKAPGTLKKHYAPSSPAELLSAEELRERLKTASGPAAVVAYSPNIASADPSVKIISMPAEPAQYAQSLYAALRYADAMQPKRIYIEKAPSGVEWKAVADRLQRASAR
ncbi:threonylcarbamoyl-AMP synthase [bacterium]|nr:threonylcarbamoyl-AMP synthase [bacterium]